MRVNFYPLFLLKNLVERKNLLIFVAVKTNNIKTMETINLPSIKVFYSWYNQFNEWYFNNKLPFIKNRLL